MPDEEKETGSLDAVYVHRDVFDAYVQKIDQRFDSLEKRMDERFDAMRVFMEKTLTEMKADNAKLRGEMQESNAQLRSEMRENIAALDNKIESSNAQLRSEIRVLDTRIDGLNARIDSVQTTVYWGFALMGIVVAMLGFFITFAPSIWGILRRRRKASVSKKEVENLISASLDKYFSQSPNLMAKPQSA